MTALLSDSNTVPIAVVNPISGKDQLRLHCFQFWVLIRDHKLLPCTHLPCPSIFAFLATLNNFGTFWWQWQQWWHWSWSRGLGSSVSVACCRPQKSSSASVLPPLLRKASMQVDQKEIGEWEIRRVRGVQEDGENWSIPAVVSAGGLPSDWILIMWPKGYYNGCDFRDQV